MGNLDISLPALFPSPPLTQHRHRNAAIAFPPAAHNPYNLSQQYALDSNPHTPKREPPGPKRRATRHSKLHPQPPTNTTTTDQDWLYCEEGEIPSTISIGASQPGLRWTKKYIWRLSPETGRVSVWFVKVAPGPEEADYLFHDFEFDSDSGLLDSAEVKSDAQNDPGEFVAPPVPSAVLATGSGNETTVLNARGNHLCINDMYRTAYAFRIEPETGVVVSWASRHVVRGPKKGQDIVNQYVRGV
ncbi:hypothetical protein N7499_001140 [Penicillium canescens]|nr:hypothetical protein N7499_001140 [Penicillium canescens]